jgi:hypothetical protein
MKRTLPLLLAALAATGAWAQKLTPGLWENTISVSTQGGPAGNPMAQMQERLAKLPPERRKQVEAMLAQQGVGVGGGGQAVRICITPEMAARDESPAQQQGCTRTAFERSGNVMRFKFECAGPPPSSGDGEFTYLSTKEWKGKVSTTTTRKGQPMSGSTTMSGRWLAADCGNVKPLPMAGAAPAPGAPKK